MKQFSILILFLLLVSGCKKQSQDPFLWDKELGNGQFTCVVGTADSLFAVCGEENGSPVLFIMTRKGKVEGKYTFQDSGSYTSVLADTGGYYVAGMSGSDMIIQRLTTGLQEKWIARETLPVNSGKVILVAETGSTILAVVSAEVSDYDAGASPLILLRADTAGLVTESKEINGANFNSVSGMSLVNGSIYLAVTTGVPGGKSKATVLKFSSGFNQVWETALFNNPAFGAGTLSLTVDNSGIVMVSGFTELPASPDPVVNSWAASLSDAGALLWKSYLEVSNYGQAVLMSDGNVTILNRNCQIINFLDPVDGLQNGRKRLFDACDSYNTGVKGWSMTEDYSGRYLVAGERSGKLYLVYADSGREEL